MKAPRNRIGERMGRLVVCESLPKKLIYGRLQPMWRCQCDCGNSIDLPSSSLSGNTNACGCVKLELASKLNKSHGGWADKTRRPLHKVWSGMNDRCHNPNSNAYGYYGGRGIFVCDEWRHDFSRFESDMGASYMRGLEIDRANNSLGYSKENCRWVSRSVNMRNTRRNRIIASNGRTMLMCEWAELTGIPATVIDTRIRLGWDTEDALTIAPNSLKVRYKNLT